MFRHAKAFRAMRDICMQHLAALRLCYAIQQEEKGKILNIVIFLRNLTKRDRL